MRTTLSSSFFASFFASFFVLAVALSIVGCGKKDKPSAEQAAAEPTAEPAGKPTADPAVDPAGKPTGPKAKDAVITVAEVGFATPESILWDPAEDVYLVSNINGAPTAVDGNGFISKVAPDGKVVALKWIAGNNDGAGAGVTLNAPKGMALTADTLWVADITHVRMFDRKTGAPKGAIELPGATFVNDVVAHGDKVWASDSGFNADFSASGTDAIWAIEGGAAKVMIKDKKLAQPNGLAVDEATGTLYVASWATTTIRALDAQGKPTAELDVGSDQLDGLVLVDGKTWLVTSWKAKALLSGSSDSPFEVLAGDIEGPADIGYDAKRRRVLIPLFTSDTIVLRPLPAN